ncbi:undecaprenyl-diphosphate phosphatase [Rhodobacteraceae bacterium NNCM2]|nr:undecaprenyl-diphosphate phosphatase [Coraliihabitans acroporae]
MDLIDIVALALIQGITEFLPISSSGHLVLWPLLTGRPDQGVTMDVAVHVGTLVAVVIYFRKDVGRLFSGAADILRMRFSTPDARLALLIAIATVPVLIVGLLAKKAGVMQSLRSVEVIGWATLIGGVFLLLADKWGGQTRKGEDWTVGGAILMGLAQACAIVPGTSRSGACMTMARALGFGREEGARIALLMAVPTILAAGLIETAGVVADGNLVLGQELALGALLSCISALVALTVMMRMFAGSWTMLPFVIYRFILGAGLLTLAYT